MRASISSRRWPRRSSSAFSAGETGWTVPFIRPALLFGAESRLACSPGRALGAGGSIVPVVSGSMRTPGWWALAMTLARPKASFCSAAGFAPKIGA